MAGRARGAAGWGAAGAAGAAGFGIAAAGVAAGGGAPGEVDAGVHAAVTASLPPEFVLGPVPHFLSDAPIAGCLAGSLGAAVAALIRGGAGAPRVRSEVLACGLTAVIVGPPGGALSEVLKALFHRTRPSELHSSFSFPSGHSLAAAFWAGTFFCVLLPLALGKRDYNAEPAEVVAEEVPHPAEWQVAAWAATVMAVGSGRLLMDVHWVSDVVGGASLGTSLVALEVAVGRGLAQALMQGNNAPDDTEGP